MDSRTNNLFYDEIWKISLLCIAKSTNWKTVQTNTNIKWNYKALSYNSNITLDIIISHYSEDWDWTEISKRPELTWEIIENNPKIKWDWIQILSHPNITWEIIKKYIDLSNISTVSNICEKNERYKEFQQDVDIWKNSKSYDEYLRNIILVNFNSKAYKNWKSISKNPNITWDIILSNINEPWNWRGISENPNISLSIIEKHPNFPWNWKNISKNINITWENINNNLNKPWNWNLISKHPNITWNIIEENLELLYYKTNKVFENVNMTWKNFKEKHNESGIELDCYFQNPNLLLYKIVKKKMKLSNKYAEHNNYIDFDLDYIYENKFDNHPYMIRKRLLERKECWTRTMNVLWLY